MEGLAGPLRVLDICPRNLSLGWALQQKGCLVVTIDTLNKSPPDHLGGVAGQSFRDVYPNGAFDVFVCILPELSENRSWADDLPKGLGEVLEVLHYYRPPVWFFVGGHWGAYVRATSLRGLRHVSFDTCCFPGAMTRHRLHVWGGGHLRETPSRVCRAAHCPHILLKRQPGCPPPRVPSQLLDYLMGWQRGLQPVALPRGDGGEPVLATWVGGLEEA